MIDVVQIDTALAAALPHGSVYAVGGRVRDELRSALDGIDRPSKDLDYVVVGLSLDELVERLRTIGRAGVVGAAFAVVKATIGGSTVDVALPRREQSTGVGHRAFDVEWGPDVSLEDDLARRDFRINMIARSLTTGALVDPYGGVADIAARRIDILAPSVFEDDPLRMLRACQFAARFGFGLSDLALASMRRSAALVVSVSPERIRDELIKLLEAASKPSIGIDLMRETGLLEYVLPEIAEGIGVAQNVYHAYDVYRHGMVTLDATPPGDAVLRLAAVLHDVGKPRTKTLEDGPAYAHFYRHEIVGEAMSRELLQRLRFPEATVERVARLVRHHMYAAEESLEPKTLRRFVGRVGLDLLETQFALRAADIVGSGLPPRDGVNARFEARVRTIIAEKPALSVRDLAISGAEVVTALQNAGALPIGSRGGPAVGVILRALLERVLDEPALNVAEQLAPLAQSLAANLQR